MRLLARPLTALLAVPILTVLCVLALAGGTSRTAAEEGQYLHFGGPDSGYIEVPSDPALNPASEITIEAWVYLTSGAGWGADADEGCPTFVGKNYKTGYWFGLDCNGSTKLRFYATGDKVVSNGSVPVNEWAHVAVSYDGAAVTFYINGVVDSTMPFMGVVSANTDPLQIGHDIAWDATPIGHIDEVHIWNIVRSKQAVALDMDTIKSPEVGLIGVWNMEGTPDATVGGFTGTLVGDVTFEGAPLTPSPTPEPPYQKGDDNCDHSLDPADLVPVLHWLAGSGFVAPCPEVPDVSIAGPADDGWFDASPNTGYIEVPDNAALNPAGAITVEARVYLTSYLSPNSGNSCPGLLGKAYRSAYWLGLCSGHLRFYSRGATDPATFRDSTGLLPLRRWVSVAAVADHASLRFYINGLLDSEFTLPEGTLGQDTSPLRIGSDVDWNVAPWGAISEVRIWDVARTQEEIQSTLGDNLTSPQDGLVAVYPLAGDANDALGNYNGSVVNTVKFSDELPPPYFPDTDCNGFLQAGDLLPLVAYLAGVPDRAPVPGGCEAIGSDIP